MGCHVEAVESVNDRYFSYNLERLILESEWSIHKYGVFSGKTPGEKIFSHVQTLKILDPKTLTSSCPHGIVYYIVHNTMRARRWDDQVTRESN